MTSSNNIPTFNDICGTVTQALAETIINREALIAELREKIAQSQDMLRERCTNYIVLEKQNIELRKEIEGWREEDRSNERYIKELKDKVENGSSRMIEDQMAIIRSYEKTIGDLRKECADLKDQVNSIRQQSSCRADVAEQAIRERDEARRFYCELAGSLEHKDPADIAKHHKWDDLYADPSIRAQHVAEQSDTDPETGVQYGDLN